MLKGICSSLARIGNPPARICINTKSIPSYASLISVVYEKSNSGNCSLNKIFPNSPIGSWRSASISNKTNFFNGNCSFIRQNDFKKPNVKVLPPPTIQTLYFFIFVYLSFYFFCFTLMAYQVHIYYLITHLFKQYFGLVWE